MNIEELKKLKEELNNIYEDEKNNGLNTTNKKICENELRDIEKEQFKVDNLIEIYQNHDKDYIIMKLERLYMILVANISENRFNELNENELYEIFDKSFPNEWVYKYSNDEKEQLLLDAIASNKIVKNPKTKKIGMESK